MKKEVYTCDISNCGNDPAYKDKELDVIFTTEQTEGRSCPPYISRQKLDICDTCMSKLLKSGKYIQATGAQGYNTYTI